MDAASKKLIEEGEVVHSLPQRLAAEGIGTAFLVAVVVGSRIMAERLVSGNLEDFLVVPHFARKS
jgi:glycerol uptake facilitator-like aquaporin